MKGEFVKIIKQTFFNLAKVIILEDTEGRPIINSKVMIFQSPLAKNFPSEENRRKLNYTSLKDVRLSEPRILVIKKVLDFILKFCRFYNQDDQEITVGGFRIIPAAWVIPYNLSLVDNIGSLASTCNCHCRFCYIDGNPYIDSRSFILSPGEARLRAKYYDPENRRGLFTINREYLEPLANPNALEIFKIIRENYPNEYITMLTNGSTLTKEVIDKLSLLKPIKVNISLNSSDPEVRGYIMNDKNPEIVLQAFAHLREKGIPFSGSIVAYKDMSFGKLEETIRFLDEMEADGIRIVLPGFTRFHKKELHFETEKWWSQVAEFIREMRRKVTNVIQLQPHAYWIQTTRAYIDGIYKNSPAHRAGLQVEDKIIRINSIKVQNKEHARNLLQQNPKRKVTVEVDRNEEILTFELNASFDVNDNFYPFKPKGYPLNTLQNYGIGLVESFKKEYLLLLVGIIKKYRSKKSVVFTSKLIRPQLEEELSKLNKAFYFGECEVTFKTIIPKFWGGNIVLGDLTMVSDYISEIEQMKREGQVPDLVLIPSSFLVDWGRDYAGDIYLDIQRKTGVRVELIPCITINF